MRTSYFICVRNEHCIKSHTQHLAINYSRHFTAIYDNKNCLSVLHNATYYLYNIDGHVVITQMKNK